MDLLFAYGTLLPGDVRWHHLQPFVVDEGATDSADGQLFDTGAGYPAAVFRAGAGLIHGRVFRFAEHTLDEALARLDEVEGAVAGDYRRVTVATHGGHETWAYAYGGGLALEPIAGGSWAEHRARIVADGEP
jgi:gamma-glutamylcyclotransferase (GGCT)/AIG2-like uncharacterized protein YtfP